MSAAYAEYSTGALLGLLEAKLNTQTQKSRSLAINFIINALKPTPLRTYLLLYASCLRYWFTLVCLLKNYLIVKKCLYQIAPFPIWISIFLIYKLLGKEGVFILFKLSSQFKYKYIISKPSTISVNKCSVTTIFVTYQVTCL